MKFYMGDAMRRLSLVFTLVLVLVAPMLGAKKSNPDLDRFLSELQDHSFKTKIVIGSTVVVYAPQYGRNMPRFVDTELSPDGTLKYYVRHGYADGANNRFQLSVDGAYINPNEITEAYSVGRSVYVSRIDLKDDRIELWLNGSLPSRNDPTNYGKLKLMLGKGYQSWEYDKFIEALSKGFRIERVERVIELDRDFAALQGQLTSKKTTYESADPKNVLARKSAAEGLRDLYLKLADNRSQVAGFGKPDASAEFKSSAAGLDGEIKALTESANRLRQAELRAKMATAQSASAKEKATLKRRHPASKTELESMRRSLERYNVALADLRNVYDELGAVGDPPSSDLLSALERDEKDAATLAGTLDEDQKRLGAREVDDKFQAMQSKRAQLEADYMSAFGSPKERSAANTLLAHLRLMYENRLTAARAGNKAAAAQADALLKDIQKFK